MTHQQIQEALKAGYSLDDINEHVNQQNNPDPRLDELEATEEPPTGFDSAEAHDKYYDDFEKACHE